MANKANTDINLEGLKDLTKAQLQEIAKQRGISSFNSKTTKDTLINMIKGIKSSDEELVEKGQTVVVPGEH